MRRDHSLNCEPVTQDTALYELVGFSSEREREERASELVLLRCHENFFHVKKLRQCVSFKP